MRTATFRSTEERERGRQYLHMSELPVPHLRKYSQLNGSHTWAPPPCYRTSARPGVHSLPVTRTRDCPRPYSTLFTVQGDQPPLLRLEYAIIPVSARGVRMIPTDLHAHGLAFRAASLRDAFTQRPLHCVLGISRRDNNVEWVIVSREGFRLNSELARLAVAARSCYCSDPPASYYLTW